MEWKVYVTRVSIYEVSAENESDAIEQALSGEILESPGGETLAVTPYPADAVFPA